MPISWLTLRNACSMDMPDSTQMRMRSIASGNARATDCWRFLMTLVMKISGILMPR